jgi:hypothetical protein
MVDAVLCRATAQTTGQITAQKEKAGSKPAFS